METNYGNNRERLIEALSILLDGKEEVVKDPPDVAESYVLSYEGKDYANIIVDRDGSVQIERLRSLASEEQTNLVLAIIRKILTTNPDR